MKDVISISQQHHLLYHQCTNDKLHSGNLHSYHTSALLNVVILIGIIVTVCPSIRPSHCGIIQQKRPTITWFSPNGSPNTDIMEIRRLSPPIFYRYPQSPFWDVENSMLLHLATAANGKTSNASSMTRASWRHHTMSAHANPKPVSTVLSLQTRSS